MIMKTLAAIGITVSSLAIGLTGCAGPTSSSKGAKSTEQAATASTLSGKVTETMDGGGYTYICLEKDGKKTWAAVPATKVTVGEEIRVMGGAEMPGFNSKALNRTFESIIFSGGLVQDKPAPVAAAAAATAQERKGPQPRVLEGKVVETMKAGKYTYMLLEKDGVQGWSAAPNAVVKVGEEVKLIPGIDMGLFKSAVLNRTFDAIHFSVGIEGAAQKQGAQLPEGHPATDATATAAAPLVAAAPPLTGKVVETAEAGGYSYICLEKDGVKTWAALPVTTVTVGQELTLAPGNVMTNFTSKSLKRTFEKIVFTNRIDNE